MVKVLDSLKLVSKNGEVLILLYNNKNLLYFHELDFNSYIEQSHLVACVRTIKEEELEYEHNELVYQLIRFSFNKLLHNQKVSMLDVFYFNRLINWFIKQYG